MTNTKPPSEVAASMHAMWANLRHLDQLGEGLTQWEIDYVESLTQQLLKGRSLSARQIARLCEICEDRIP